MSFFEWNFVLIFVSFSRETLRIFHSRALSALKLLETQHSATCKSRHFDCGPFLFENEFGALKAQKFPLRRAS
jgi:hypothetical protein